MNILIDGQVLSTEEMQRGIGIYFRNTTEAMVSMTFEHRWFIAIPDKDALVGLDPWVSEQLVPVVDKRFAPTASCQEKNEAYTEALISAVDTNHIDIFWTPDPLMLNVMFPVMPLLCKFVATIYDLIPAVMPLEDWPEENVGEYRRRLKYLNKNNVNCLFISKATECDARKFIGENIKGTVVPLGVDCAKFGNSDLARKENKTVFTGGYDYRKNISGAIDSFVRMKQKFAQDELVRDNKLFIICRDNAAEREKYQEKLRKSGFYDDVVFTGYVSDEELARHYATASVFFFPSLYEGFGLPILEAMLCGDYIVSADNSSLPEVCGGKAMLFATGDNDDAADKLHDALHIAAEESIDEKTERSEYAARFTWEKTASATVSEFEKIMYGDVPEKKTDYSIAVVTPWPEQRTGVANFEYRMMPYMAKYFKIDIFTDDTVSNDCNFRNNPAGELFSIDELDERYEKYDAVIFEIGNNADFHRGIYEKLLKHKGIAEIHDFSIGLFLFVAFYAGGDEETYRKALVEAYGDEGLRIFEQIKKDGQVPDVVKYPCCEAAIKNSSSVIFHNKWCASQVNGLSGNVYVVPLPSFDRDIPTDREKQEREQLRARVPGISDDDFIIGCFGEVTRPKRPEAIMRAARKLKGKGYKFKVVFWGSCGIGDFDEIASRYEIDDIVSCSGYLSGDDYARALVSTDIVVNLRYPTIGESSGTLCEALKYGKPVIVSDINQYKEFPDDVCWKLPTERFEAETLARMLACLMDREDVRCTLAENARKYADSVLSPEKIAITYQRCIMNDINSKIKHVINADG